MSILTSKEIRSLDPKSLDKKLADLKLELMKLRSQKISGGVPENSGRMKELRRTIARIATIRRELKKK